MSLLEPREPDDLHHLAAAYALDALDTDERRRFEAHYPRCPTCANEVAGFRATAANLAEAVSVPAPADLKARVMADVANTRQLPPIVPDRVAQQADRRRRRLAAALGSAAAAIVVVAVAGLTLLRSPGEPDPILELLALPGTVVSTLEGPDGTLRLVWSPSRDEIGVIGEGLAKPGEGQTYALWFLLDDGAAPAGLFEPTGSGSIREILTVDDIDGIGFGVTIEPDGGSPQPTTPVLYSAEL